MGLYENMNNKFLSKRRHLSAKKFRFSGDFNAKWIPILNQQQKASNNMAISG